jgi:hypothetical protein
LKICLCGVVGDFKLNVSKIKIKIKMDENWKIDIIETFKF